MMSVSPLRALNIIPSGGVTPENLPSWWDAGARAVGMGTNLAGKDINYSAGDFKDFRFMLTLILIVLKLLSRIHALSVSCSYELFSLPFSIPAYA